MRESFSISHSAGRFVIPNRALSQLGLSKSARLYGRVICDTEEAALILSVIPTQAWVRAHRIIAHTGHRTGSLKYVLDMLHAERLNIYHATASATSARGELCIAATVELPARNLGELFDPYTSAKKLEDRLRGKLQATNIDGHVWASKSLIYDANGGPHPLISVSELRTLRGIPTLVQSKGHPSVPDIECVFDIRDGELNLAADLVGQRNVFTHLWNPDFHPGIPGDILLTTDTEEHYIRIAVLPRGRYISVDVPIVLKSATNDFSGAIAAVSTSVLDPDIDLNVYYSTATVISREEMNVGDSIGDTDYAGQVPGWRESIEVRLVGQVAGRMKYDPIQDIEQRVEDLVVKGVTAHARTQESIIEAPVVRSTNEKSGGQAVKVSGMDETAPLVFVASNVKKDMGAYVDFYRRICRLVRRRGCRPVMIDKLRIVDNPITANQIIELVRFSVAMVSVYLPEPACRLSNAAKSRARAGPQLGGTLFAPNAWVMYEECRMMSQKRNLLIRAVHKSVWNPPYTDVIAPLVFDDSSASMDATLSAIGSRLDGAMLEDAWRERFEATIEARRECLHDKGWLERLDPETWLVEHGPAHSHPPVVVKKQSTGVRSV